MSGVQEFDFAQAWRLHREGGAVAFAPLPGGFAAVDRGRTPPRVWVLTCDAPGQLPRALHGTVEGAGAMSPVEAAARLSGGGAGRPLSPREVAALLGMCPEEESLVDLSVRRFMESLPDDQTRARAPLDRMREAEAQRAAAAGMDVFRAVADEAALRCLSAAEDAGWNEYKFYAEGGRGEREPSAEQAARRTVRQQAAQTYPMLAKLFATRWTLRAALDDQARFMVDRAPLKQRMDDCKAAGDEAGMAEAKAALDALPKPPALLDAMDKALTPLRTPDNPEPKPTVSRAALARIQGIPFGPRGMAADQLAMFMTEMPPDWFPKKGADWTAEEWTAFTDLAATVGVVLRRLTGSRPEVLFEGCSGKWSAMRDRVAKAFTDTRPPGGLDDEGLAALQAAIDWKGLGALPRHKVPGAAAAAEARLREAGLVPQEVAAGAVADWMVRLVAPPRDRETIMNQCLQTSATVHAFASKVLVPAAATLAADGQPTLGPEQFEAAERAAARLLFGGKSAVKVFETQAAFLQNAAIIGAAGNVEEDFEGLEEDVRETLLRKVREEQEKRRAALQMNLVGVSLNETPDWVIPFPAVVQAPNGLYLCTLFSERQMEDEGRGFGGIAAEEAPVQFRREGRGEKNEDGSYGMRLCVGGKQYGHISMAKDGRAFFTSVRAPGELKLPGEPVGDGAPYHRISLSKAGFTKTADGKWKHRIYEHSGFANGRAPEAAVEAITWFYDAIERGLIPHGLDQMEEKKDMRAAGGQVREIDRIEERAGYDWRRSDRVGKAWKAWHPVVGKGLRVGLGKLMTHPELRALASELSPGWEARAAMRDEAAMGRGDVGDGWNPEDDESDGPEAAPLPAP